MGNTASCNSDSSGGTSYVKQNQSSTASFFSGMATGMAGMMGVSGFWDPYGSQGFDKLTADYNTMKEQLQDQLDSIDAKIQEESQIFLNEQLQYIQLMNDFHMQQTDESLDKNWLTTTTIFTILIIILIYLLVI